MKKSTALHLIRAEIAGSLAVIAWKLGPHVWTWLAVVMWVIVAFFVAMFLIEFWPLNDG